MIFLALFIGFDFFVDAFFDFLDIDLALGLLKWIISRACQFELLCDTMRDLFFLRWQSLVNGTEGLFYWASEVLLGD